MITIQKLSQEVSIGTDTLRVWERRYGFPAPKRDARGHRLYPTEQVEDLRIVKKLQSLGWRPNKIFSLSSSDRREQLARELDQKTPANKSLLNLVHNLDPLEIDTELRHLLQKSGPEEFIVQQVAPLLYALDLGWTDGSLSIAHEHLISDCLEDVMKDILKTGKRGGSRHRLLFLTLSGERHKLGLLMSAVLFHCHGVECIVLSETIPHEEIPALAEELQVSGVALSFSAHYSNQQTKKDLAKLRAILDRDIMIIAGGESVRQGVKIPNVSVCTELETITELCNKNLS